MANSGDDNTTVDNDAAIESDDSGADANDPPINIPTSLSGSFTTDFSKSSLRDYSQVVQGVSGSPKDRIPALTNPKFTSIVATEIADDVRGLYLEIDGIAKFYPYSILVWHEIANDMFGDTPVVVTFCPLCGSAIAYDPVIDDEVLEFGVSGFLRESNMVMYDRSTDSLWQQSTGLGFAGIYNTVQLERYPVQLKTLGEVRDLNASTLVLSTDTGHSRSYDYNPYGDYDTDNSDFVFTPSEIDDRYEAKELFFIIPTNEQSVALRYLQLGGDTSLDLEDGTKLKVTEEEGLLEARDASGKLLAGYYEMWFSWAIWHGEDGIVWDPSE